MILLLVITALGFAALGAGIGYLAGFHVARDEYREDLAEIAALNHQLYEQPAYGDD